MLPARVESYRAALLLPARVEFYRAALLLPARLESYRAALLLPARLESTTEQNRGRDSVPLHLLFVFWVVF